MHSRAMRRIKRVALSLGLVAVAGSAATVYLLQREPAAWTVAEAVLDQSTPQERAQIAERIETKLERLGLNAPSGDDPIAERLAPDQAIEPAKLTLKETADLPVDEVIDLPLSNRELVALVSDTFDDWAKQRGYVVPEQLTQPTMVVEGGRLMLVFQVSVSGWSQVFTGPVELSFDEDGMANGKVTRLTAGSLPVSVDGVGQMLRERLPASQADKAEVIGQWLSQLEGFEFRPVLRLENRRRVRVLAMDVAGNGVNLKLRVQDHRTYRQHNALLKQGAVAVTDPLGPAFFHGDAFADVPTISD